ncbi:MAG: lactate utilization protein [Oscillospiraceae bacterium]
MDANLHFVETKRLERIKQNLERNNINTILLETAAEVVPLLQSLLPKGASISNGGSITLQQCGVTDLLRSGDYQYLDREAPGADRIAIGHQSFTVDYYLASANAITEAGEIYAIDGIGNRIAALAFGPERVILVAGCNKIVPDIAAARARNTAISGPANAHRVGAAQSPCVSTGFCSDCRSDTRICNMELVLRHQREAKRVTLILVNESLGY